MCESILFAVVLKPPMEKMITAHLVLGASLGAKRWLTILEPP
jgi:hypothetical protein